MRIRPLVAGLASVAALGASFLLFGDGRASAAAAKAGTWEAVSRTYYDPDFGDSYQLDRLVSTTTGQVLRLWTDDDDNTFWNPLAPPAGAARGPVGTYELSDVEIWVYDAEIGDYVEVNLVLVNTATSRTWYHDGTAWVDVPIREAGPAKRRPRPSRGRHGAPDAPPPQGR